ncbi:MAG TPA: glycoside hydrolase family 15 protein, partial [Segeticoccus sp.]|uniref:glycoside hydrolase family 15 protein n=1 Tax=Segeticoccus sp. TaxID=2706531 RepID=UPI002D805E54
MDQLRSVKRALVALPALSLLLAAAPVSAMAADHPDPDPPAAGGPGALSHFDLARKDCLGTAANRTSTVWFTVADGVLSDVYSPTIDNTNVETLQYVVTDGHSFTDLQTRDMTYSVRSTDSSGMACEVTSRDKDGKYSLVTDYITDPARDSVVMRTKVVSETPGLQVYVRYDATMNGNGGGGTDNGGADDAVVDPATTALVSSDVTPKSQAVNRDYAVPLFGALRADQPFTAAESGFVRTPSDGLTQLDDSHQLTSETTSADQGNVVQTARVAVGHDGTFTLALGYGQTAGDAVATAGRSADAPFALTYQKYVKTWRTYDRSLRPPPKEAGPGGPGRGNGRSDAYYLSANVLKASEDKTFPGAVVASMASPWGQAVSAGAKPGGLPVFFESYRTVFSRDLYEAFTGFLADGDLATARDTVRFLFQRQQLADGRFPRNSLLNGAKAPSTGGDQLDESAYPILMAWQAGLTDDKQLYTEHIKRAADFVVAHGPSFGSERWEEQSGYSPSTIAA